MHSDSSRARIFSVSLYWIADLMPRRTLRRISSLERMASVRSFFESFRDRASFAASRMNIAEGGRGETDNDGEKWITRRRRER